jgi:hypothetical protein
VLGSLFGSFTDALGKRFLLTAWLPSLLLVSAVLAEVAIAAGMSRTTSWVQAFPGLLQAVGVAVFALVVTLVAVLVSVNTTSLLRLCEGYWGHGWIDRHIGCRRRAHYQEVIAELDKTDAGYEQIYQRFPPYDLRNRALPTRVGNILLSSELYGYVRYGIDAVLVWPRLYQAAPDSFRTTLASARTAMDQLISLMACGVAFAVAGTATAVILLPWWAVPLCFVIGLILAIVSYRGLVSACIPYAETVRAGFDLYRGSLLSTIGWHPAQSLTSERHQWSQIGGLWYRISPADPAALGYQPIPASYRPPADQGHPAPAAECAQARPMAHLWWRVYAAAAIIAAVASVVGAARERVISPSPFPDLTTVVAVGRLQAFSTIQPAQLRIEHQGWSPFVSGLAIRSQQVTGHALRSEVPAGQPIPVSQIGPVIPPGTVALSAALTPAESLAAQVSPGDVVDVTPVCVRQPGDWIAELPAVTVLDVRGGPVTSGALPASTTVVLAIPADVASQAAEVLLTCQVALTPAS